MNPDYIFVYGTLRRDEHNPMSELLVRSAEFVGEAVYQGKLFKIDYYPGVIPSIDSNDRVSGEVYRLEQADAVLELLDQYEEVGPDFLEPNEYVRQQQNVVLNDGSAVAAWIYLYNRSTQGLERIKEFSELK